MGYEVIFYYHEKSDNDNFNFSETKTITKKIGSSFEELSKKDLAKVILKQLARRDIFVKDVEIYEYVKKKILFKETKNHLVVGKEKISLENLTGEVSKELVDDDEKSPITIRQSPTFNDEVKSSTVIPATNKVLRTEYFSPLLQQTTSELASCGIYLTPGKMYRILREEVTNKEDEIDGKTILNSVYYLIIDDKNEKKTVNSSVFLPSFKDGLSVNKVADYGNAGMPVLRRSGSNGIRTIK